MRKTCQFFVHVSVDPTGICGKPAVDEAHGMSLCADHYDQCQRLQDTELNEGDHEQATSGSNVAFAPAQVRRHE